VAPGVEIERDIRPRVGFPLRIAPDLQQMPARIFAEGPLGLAHDFAGRTR
jgi:propionate CoA-transferase